MGCGYDVVVLRLIHSKTIKSYFTPRMRCGPPGGMLQMLHNWVTGGLLLLRRRLAVAALWLCCGCAVVVLCIITHIKFTSDAVESLIH